jgi:hypothetical protein
LLDTALLKDLRLLCCEFERGSFPSEDIAQRRVAQAFGANSSIISLALGRADGSEAYFFAILDALQSNVTVERLTIQRCCLRFSDETPALVIDAIVIGNLLQSTIGQITHVRLDDFNWTDNSFAPIASSIRTSTKIQSLEFRNCVFHHSACRQLCSIFSHGSSASCLSLLSGVEFLPTALEGRNCVLTEILQTSPTLRQLSMFNSSYDEEGLFQAVLNALTSESCSVERLILDTLWDSHCPALFDALASFGKVQYVSFDISSELDVLMRNGLMAAFRRNGTLLDSNVTGGGLDDSDQARLHAYHQRNGSPNFDSFQDGRAEIRGWS